MPQVHGLKEAVASVQAAGRRAVVATPRVLKPDEVNNSFWMKPLASIALSSATFHLLTASILCHL